MGALSRVLGDGAVEGLPMSLAVTMIVLAITVPLILGGFRAYDRSRVEAELESEIGSAMAVIQMLYASGPGNSAMLEFSAAAGAFSSVEGVTFGDSPRSALSTTVRYSLAGRAEVVLPTGPPAVPMMTAAGTGLSLGGGSHRIFAECLATGEDLNGDSLVPDAYVSLSLLQ
jgi:hypothetical protein